MFSLEKLKVYERALGSVASLTQLAGRWDKRHAVVDQLLLKAMGVGRIPTTANSSIWPNPRYSRPAPMRS